ncbi:MAG: ABC transporter ATP-binding protein [Polaromonas sp.]|nr:ABC transporter ATP-binding protein [Polaromonas sp.]
MEKQVLLRIDAVDVQFGALKAVDSVSLAIKTGERRALIGSNGAGKTTLFNAITGMTPPTRGRIFFDNKDITHKTPEARARLGLGRTFQITNLFPSLTIHENMLLAARGLSVRKYSLLGALRPTGAEDRLIKESLLKAGIPGQQANRVSELSYGAQRQLELAMALATQPRLLLLDEPAAGLSPTERAVVIDVVRSLGREITIVLIEHDLELALGLVDFVTCMYNGKVLAEDTPERIRSNTAVQDVYLGSAVHA